MTLLVDRNYYDASNRPNWVDRSAQPLLSDITSTLCPCNPSFATFWNALQHVSVPRAYDIVISDGIATV